MIAVPACTRFDPQRDLFVPVDKRQRDDYRRAARWWELESKRCEVRSRDEAAFYARSMRYAATLVEMFGPGTWTELHARKDAHDKAERRRRVDLEARLRTVRAKS